MHEVVPISAVIATRNRAASLSRALESLLSQELLPAEFIVVDASDDEATRKLLAELEKRVQPDSAVRWLAASVAGAAPQRNQGFAHATQPFVWFFDDDILFEPNCAQRLWSAISSDRQLGGVNAMIVNQRYESPGIISRTMFTLMHGRREKSFAGRVIGPAINLLPEDREDLPEVVPVEWLNTTCTIYRREALPDPPFRAEFTGYSLMEDVALSLEVGKNWKLANARTARIFHDSQPGDYKSDQSMVSCMELLNRHFVMTRVMGKRALSDYLKLALWELFSLASVASGKTGRANLPSILRGKWRGVRHLMSGNPLP